MWESGLCSGLLRHAQTFRCQAYQGSHLTSKEVLAPYILPFFHYPSLPSLSPDQSSESLIESSWCETSPNSGSCKNRMPPLPFLPWRSGPALPSASGTGFCNLLDALMLWGMELITSLINSLLSSNLPQFPPNTCTEHNTFNCICKEGCGPKR